MVAGSHLTGLLFATLTAVLPSVRLMRKNGHMVAALASFLIVFAVFGSAVTVAFLTQHRLAWSNTCGLAAAVSFLTWLIVVFVMAGAGLDISEGFGARGTWLGLGISAFFVLSAGAFSIYEHVTDTQAMRRSGYSIKAWWPRWAVISAWITAAIAVPFVTLYGLGKVFDNANLTEAQLNTAIDMAVTGATLAAISIFLAGLIYTYFVRDRRIRKNVAAALRFTN